MFQQIMTVILNVLVVMSALFVLYYFFYSLFGFWPIKRRYEMKPDTMRFAIVVPAHNEEAVITATIDSLISVAYSRSLFDVYIVADNCKDNTATIAREHIVAKGLHNFFVRERRELDKLQQGKPHVIRWLINHLEQTTGFYKNYDFMMILDADNFVDASILSHFNSQYLSKPEHKRPMLIQCYLDSKNDQGFIARGYSAAYRISQRFYQMAKYRVGVNPIISGTGYVIHTQFLKSIGGFLANSLTEDLEIQTIATIQGVQTWFNPHTRIYDERPTQLKASLAQKTRWTQGHWWNAFHYAGRLFLSLFHSKSPRQFFTRLDHLIYLFAMTNYAITTVTLVVNIILMITGYQVQLVVPQLTIVLTAYSVFNLVFSFPIAVFVDGLPHEKKRFFKHVLFDAVAISFGGLVFSVASIIGLFKFRNQKVWVKTEHHIVKMPTIK